MKHLTRIMILLLCTSVFACSESDSEQVQNAVAARTQLDEPDTKLEIDWFEGSVEEAFARAKAEERPLYLYWGAVWCPPCEEIKQTVFQSPSFIYQSRLFVAVYLDGDTPRAQQWGEHFAVQGYPTMIVFNPAGAEVTRIPGGIDVQRYAEVLGLSLERLRPTEDLVALAQSNPAALEHQDFMQLAFYSWSQSTLNLDQKNTAAFLLRLAGEARARRDAAYELAASRLMVQGLALFSMQEGAVLSPRARADYQAQLRALLGDPSLVAASLDLLSFYSREIMELVGEPSPERRELAQYWIEAMAHQRESKKISGAERLASWYPAIHFYWLEQSEDAEALPEELQSQLRAAVRRADEETTGSARQSVIHRASRILQAAKMLEDSRALLAAEVEKNPSSYYFLSSLAEVEEMLGENEAALKHGAAAYEHAEGTATRFQWGVEHLTAMTRLAPDRSEEILQLSKKVLAEVKGEELFAGRNVGRLQTLLGALEQWSAERSQGDEVAKALGAIEGQIAQRCIALPEHSQARQNCTSLTLANTGSDGNSAVNERSAE